MRCALHDVTGLAEFYMIIRNAGSIGWNQFPTEEVFIDVYAFTCSFDKHWIVLCAGSYDGCQRHQDKLSVVFVLGVDSPSSPVATSHRWLFKSRLTIIKPKINTQFLVEVAIFQVFSNHLWLVTLVMDSADVDSFHHCRKFIWTTRVQRKRWS